MQRARAIEEHKAKSAEAAKTIVRLETPEEYFAFQAGKLVAYELKVLERAVAP